MASIVEISDLSLAALDAYCRLTEAQLRSRQTAENARFIAESPKVIMHALDAGYEPLSLLTDRKHLNGSARELIARLGDKPVYTADAETLKALTGFELTRGVLCAMRRKPLPEVGALLADARRVAVLEGIVDPTNVGAIFRSAAALGADALLLTPDCCDALHRRAVRVSMGTVFQIPWTYLESWPEGGAETLHSLGFKTAALALDDRAVDIDDERLRAEKRLALVLGTEGDGLKRATLERCDYTARIPMGRGVDSLNVAAASAVAFWQLRIK